jgi:septal ring factor EnvC (AmiA/AmiB activator)
VEFGNRATMTGTNTKKMRRQAKSGMNHHKTGEAEMSEKLISIPAMHNDHRNWQSRYSMWQDDLIAWQKELGTAMNEARELLTTLDRQASVLSEHKTKIDNHQSALTTHEHEIAASEKFGNEVPDSLTATHQEMVRQADSFARQHERIKKHHHALIAKLNEIHKLAEVQ